MVARIERESATLPYRWGYSQGALLIPWSLFILFAESMALRGANAEPWYISALAMLIGLVGLPLGIGLLAKKRFALLLVYVTFGLTLALAAIKLPIAILHYRDPGDRGSAIFEAEMLLFWLICMVYYRKRQSQFK
jgi:hypothetical protein